MCQGWGLNKHDVAMRLSSATGRSYENVSMDLNRVSSGPLWSDSSRLSERAFGEFAGTQGLSAWDAARVVSDIQRIGLEAAHHKNVERDIPPLKLTQLDMRECDPVPVASRSTRHSSPKIGSLRASNQSCSDPLHIERPDLNLRADSMRLERPPLTM